jgi:hypothetical protein
MSDDDGSDNLPELKVESEIRESENKNAVTETSDSSHKSEVKARGRGVVRMSKK